MQPFVRERDRPARRLFVAAAVAAMIVGTVATPAGANAPTEFEDSATFTDINPCTQSEMEVTIHFDVSIHEHQNNFVVTLQRSGSTEPGGYTMLSGNETFVENAGGAHGHFNDVWRNDEGSTLRAWGVFVFNALQGEVKVDQFRLQCVSA